MDSEKHPRLSKVLRFLPLAVMAGLIAFAAVSQNSLTVEAVLSYTPGEPLLAALVLVALYALKSLSVVFPTWILAVAGARLFSLPAALLINGAGTAVALTVPYCVARYSGGGAVERLVERHPKLSAVRSFRVGGDFFFSFLTRIVGLFSCDLVSMYMGAIQLPFTPYLLGAFCGFFPHVAAYTLMGDAIDDPSSPEFRVALAALLCTIAVSTCGYLISQHRKRQKTA